MNITRRNLTVGGLSLLAGASASSLARAHFGEARMSVGDDLEDFWIATEAYIYGYPLVTMEMTRRVITNVVEPEGTRGPMGHIIKLREYPDASFRDVTAPNADTLYTTAFFDVGKEPWVLEPARHEGPLLPVADARRLDQRVPGARQAHHRDRRPDLCDHRSGLDGHASRGRQGIQVADRASSGCSAASTAPARRRTTPRSTRCRTRSSWCRSAPMASDYTPPPGKVDPSIDMKTAVREQVNRMDAVEYFTLLCELMKTNPPAAADAPVLARMARIGLVAGQGFRRQQARRPTSPSAFRKIAFDRIMLQFKFSDGDVKDINGWGFTTKTGIYGTNYLERALVTAIGLGANRPQDAVYPTSLKRRRRHATYDGANKYVMHFAKGQMPPVERLLVADDVRRRTTSSSPIRSTATRSARART